MRSECQRHGLNDQSRPYYIERCSHLDNRFVVIIRNRIYQTGFVDYVDDSLDGDKELTVESHYYTSPAESDKLFDDLVERMLADDPPNTELCT